MATEPCPALVTSDGRGILVADGPDLLVHGPDGGPRYAHFLDGIAVDLASVGSLICSLDTEGVVRWLQAHDGSEQARAQGAVAAGLTAGGGRLASFGPAGVQWLAPGQAPVQGVAEPLSGAALSADGSRLGVALQAGPFWSLDPTSGGSWGQVDLGGAAGGVAWSVRDFFVVVVGNQLHRVAPDGTEIQASIGLPGLAVAVEVSPEGVVAAVRVGEGRVVLVDLHGDVLAGHLDFRRPVKDIAFSPDGRLLIGLDDGDASLIDLYTGASLRTEPHRGRGRNNWNYDNLVDVAVLRGAIAHAQAGGAPIAQYIGPPEEGRNWLRTCLVIFLIWSLLCCGCSGISGLFYYVQG